MKERHEREIALKVERDLQAKDAADREAALQVYNHSIHLDVACMVSAALKDALYVRMPCMKVDSETVDHIDLFKLHFIYMNALV